LIGTASFGEVNLAPSLPGLVVGAVNERAP
jgi:hypothetical protein